MFNSSIFCCMMHVCLSNYHKYFISMSLGMPSCQMSGNCDWCDAINARFFSCVQILATHFHNRCPPLSQWAIPTQRKSKFQRVGEHSICPSFSEVVETCPRRGNSHAFRPSDMFKLRTLTHRNPFCSFFLHFAFLTM